MDGWIDRLAEGLGEEPLTPAETERLLHVAREVAHRVERRVTPLSTFLLGAAVGRGLAVGTPRGEALPAALGALETLLPDEPDA